MPSCGRIVWSCHILSAVWIGLVAAYLCRRCMKEIHWFIWVQLDNAFSWVFLFFLEVDEIISQILDFFRINWTISIFMLSLEDVADMVVAISVIRSLQHPLLASDIYSPCFFYCIPDWSRTKPWAADWGFNCFYLRHYLCFIRKRSSALHKDIMCTWAPFSNSYFTYPKWHLFD